MMMVLFFRVTTNKFFQFSCVHAQTATHTLTHTNLLSPRSGSASAALHTTLNVLCVALNFLFAFRKSVHIVNKSANEETHATDGIERKKNVRCVRIEVCTVYTHEGKK